MLVWSVGLIPVQEWISEARRSRDLRIGSALLSWLMARTLKALQDHGATVFVPRLQSMDAVAAKSPAALLSVDYGIPNRATGWWSGGDPGRAFDSLQNTVDENWNAFREAIKPTVMPRILEPYVASARNPIRVVWCTQPIAVAASQFSAAEQRKALEAIDQLYSAVKRTRPMVVNASNAVGKCGQCGRRDAAGPDEWAPWRDFQRDLEGRDEIEKGHRLDKGERLCGVCLLKRFGGYLSERSFPSTSEIASAEWRSAAAGLEDLARLLKDWEKLAGKVEKEDPYPLLYGRTLRRRKEEAGSTAESEGIARTLESIRALASTIESEHPHLPAQPSNYLAVVTFDGDDMGKKIQAHPEDLPPALMKFSENLSPIVASHRATAFYLGGDEGLILCPIETCLALAGEIHKAFGEAVRKALPDLADPITISAGVAIFDRERPLAAAIQAARDALRAAKNLDADKNALGVTVTTASGNSWTALDHWGAGWTRVFEAVDLARGGRLSSGWAYDIEELLETIPDDFLRMSTAREALGAEIRRITGRRLVRPRKTRTGDPSRDTVANEGLPPGKRLEGWATFTPDAQTAHMAGQLHLVAFLLRESQPAGGEEAAVPTQSEVAR